MQLLCAHLITLRFVAPYSAEHAISLPIGVSLSRRQHDLIVNSEYSTEKNANRLDGARPPFFSTSKFYNGHTWPLQILIAILLPDCWKIFRYHSTDFKISMKMFPGELILRLGTLKVARFWANLQICFKNPNLFIGFPKPSTP